MTVLPNYLYNKIIILLLNQIYLNHTSLTVPDTVYEGLFKYHHNEAINFSLVNKSFFELVSNNLTLQILNFKNYTSFTSLNRGSKFNLIKQKNSIKVYNSLLEFQKDFNNSNNNIINNNFRKILINSRYEDESIKILLSSNQDYENIDVRFNLMLRVGRSLAEINNYSIEQLIENKKKINTIKIYHFRDIDIGNNDYGNEINNQIDDISDYQAQSNYINIFQKILKLEPKTIDYYPILDDFSTFYPNISSLFQSKSLKFFRYNSDYVAPASLELIDVNSSNLKSLSLPIMFRQLIRCFNGLIHLSNRNLKQDWIQMCKTISSLSKLKYLLLDPNSFNDVHFTHQELLPPPPNNIGVDLTVITYGIRLMLQNTKSIEFLEFSNFDFIDNNILTGLINNKSISTLAFTWCKKIDRIFKVVLPKNNRIRNLEFKDHLQNDKELFGLFNNLLNFLKNIKNNSNNNNSNINNSNINNCNSINSSKILYSLTLQITIRARKINHIEFLDYLKSLSNHINEIILYLPSSFSTKINCNQITFNNSIIKFYFSKK